MIEIALQYKNGIYAPATADEVDKAARSHKDYQIIRGKLTEVRDARSLKQLRMYWGSCNLVAENFPKPGLETKDSVDWHTRIALRFYDENKIAVDGPRVIVQLKSIAFENLKHLAMNDFMDRALKVHADWLGVSKGEIERELRLRGMA